MKMMLVEECCEILDSMRVPITASEREEGEYPYYGANGIQDHVANYIFDDELVLLAEDGGNFGSKERPIAYRVSGKCWVNNHAHVLKPKEGLDVDYLCYSLMFYKVDGMVNGATRQKLTQTAMRKMQVPLRSMEEQLHIVDILNHIAKIKTEKEQELELLDDLIQARFIEMFGSVSTGSCKYETRKLGDVSVIGSSHRVFTKEFVEVGIPFYRGTEISELANGLHPTNPYYITEEHYYRLTSDDTKPKIGDLLMPSICNKGQVWMVNTEEPFYYKDGRVLCISPNRRIFNTKYFEYYMREKTLIEYSRLGSGSTFAEFKIFLLKDMDVLLPPIELQNQFADFVRATDKLKVEVQKSLDETQMLFDSLMQKYFG